MYKKYSSLRLPSFRLSPASGLSNNYVKWWRYSTNSWVLNVMFCLQNDKFFQYAPPPSISHWVLGKGLLGNIFYEISLITYVTLLWLLENSVLNKYYLYYFSLSFYHLYLGWTSKLTVAITCLKEPMHLLELQSI